MERRLLPVVLGLLILGLACPAPAPEGSKSSRSTYGIEEKTVAEMIEDMESGRVTSEQLVEVYLDRIDSLDRSGPNLRSVLSLNPRAVDEARELDAERAAGKLRGPLHGVPVLLKDNIESADPLPTTAGSLVLADNVGNRDAPIVARLRDAGAVILGKTNLSEWANIRSSHSTSGCNFLTTSSALARSFCRKSVPIIRDLRVPLPLTNFSGRQ